MNKINNGLWAILQSMTEDSRVNLAAIGLITAAWAKLPAVSGDFDRAIESIWMMAEPSDQSQLQRNLEALTEYGYLKRSVSAAGRPWGYSYAIGRGAST